MLDLAPKAGIGYEIGCERAPMCRKVPKSVYGPLMGATGMSGDADRSEAEEG